MNELNCVGIKSLNKLIKTILHRQRQQRQIY